MSVEFSPRPREQSHRISGELEKLHNRAPLEDTPITLQAKTRLKGWGFSEKHIQRLREITSSFRYDLCPEKAKRIAEKGGYLYTRVDGKKEVVIPDFFNYEKRGDGQCADLAYQHIEALFSSGFMEEVNRDLAKQDKPSLRVHYVKGLSRTHFNQQPNDHAWVGFLPQGKHHTKLVAVDPSFQEISNIDSNGYRIMDIKNHRTNPRYSSIEVELGEYTLEKNGVVSIDLEESVVLGASLDRKFVYKLGFAARTNDGQIGPIVLGADHTGHIQTYCLLKGDNSIGFVGKNPDGVSFTRAHKKEMTDIMVNIGGLPLREDQQKALEIKFHEVPHPSH